jgi:hypothetical protein
MNAEELRTVVDEIDALVADAPARFDMHDWVYAHPDCGTAACLAGWAMTEDERQQWVERKSLEDPWEIAMRRFDLNYNEADALFLIRSGWPTAFKNAYFEAASGQARVAALRARVEHFIATGE